jgi:hypothetical protein
LLAEWNGGDAADAKLLAERAGALGWLALLAE